VLPLAHRAERTPNPPWRSFDVLTYEQFWSLLDRELALDCECPGRDAVLSDDLGLDSLQLIELVVVMEELGAEVFEDLLPVLVTADDLYRHYRNRLEAEEGHVPLER
jgi:acyl carrier protein